MYHHHLCFTMHSLFTYSHASFQEVKKFLLDSHFLSPTFTDANYLPSPLLLHDASIIHLFTYSLTSPLQRVSNFFTMTIFFQQNLLMQTTYHHHRYFTNPSLLTYCHSSFQLVRNFFMMTIFFHQRPTYANYLPL